MDTATKPVPPGYNFDPDSIPICSGCSRSKQLVGAFYVFPTRVAICRPCAAVVVAGMLGVQFGAAPETQRVLPATMIPPTDLKKV